MKLQRYEIDMFERGLTPDDNGFLVYHSEALDWFESLLAPIPSCIKYSEVESVDINQYLESLRALIAVERGKV